MESSWYSYESWFKVFCLVVLAYWTYVFVERKLLNLPPGPWGLPVVGYLPFLSRGQQFKQLAELGKKYGGVIRISVFGTNLIVLNSYEAIRECFHNKGEEFSGRVVQKKSFFTYLFEGLGFLQEEGPRWRELRRFSLHTLRDFGFGKLSLEGRVQEIGGDLLKGFENTKGKPYDPNTLLGNTVFNVILYLLTDKHFHQDDPDFRMIRGNVRAVLTSIVGLNVFISTPLSKILPMEWQPKFSLFSKVKKQFYGLSGRLIKEHEDTFQENNMRDFIDAYLAEGKAALKEGKEDTTFTFERLRVSLLNLLVAGTETTSNTMYWGLRLISARPEIQAKLHKELDDVIGRDRLPSILDRSNLPYTEAFILELLRYTTVAPLGIPHSNPAAANLMGYTIPTRSVIVANLWGVHNDPEFWQDPEKFDPDRFMDPSTRTKRRERVVSFSIGKRSCLGESLARMELFLFLTMLLQKFSFELPEGDSGDIQEKKAFVRFLEPYEICARPRT